MRKKKIRDESHINFRMQCATMTLTFIANDALKMRKVIEIQSS